MIKINKFQNQYYDYNGIIIIQSENVDNLIKELHSDDAIIEIGNSEFKISDFIIIDPLTKLIDLYQISSKNILYKYIVNSLEWTKEVIFNSEILEKYNKNINDFIGEEFSSYLPDYSKIIKYIYDFNQDKFIDKNTLIKWLNNFKLESKNNIILKNVDFIKLSDISEYINNYNFIFLTNNAFNIIENLTDLELVYLENDGYLFHIENYEVVKFEIYKRDSSFKMNHNNLPINCKNKLRKIRNIIQELIIK